MRTGHMSRQANACLQAQNRGDHLGRRASARPRVGRARRRAHETLGMNKAPARSFAGAFSCAQLAMSRCEPIGSPRSRRGIIVNTGALNDPREYGHLRVSAGQSSLVQGIRIPLGAPCCTVNPQVREYFRSGTGPFHGARAPWGQRDVNPQVAGRTRVGSGPTPAGAVSHQRSDSLSAHAPTRGQGVTLQVQQTSPCQPRAASSSVPCRPSGIASCRHGADDSVPTRRTQHRTSLLGAALVSAWGGFTVWG
jgi:hypothetical protein